MINVVYITDENYAMPTCVSIRSLIDNTKSDSLNIYVIAEEISSESKRAFESLQTDSNCALEIVSIDAGKYDKFAKLDKIKSGDVHVTPCSIYKFELAEILSECDRVLYLDGDIIVQGDVGEIYNTDLGTNYLAAAKEMGDNYSEGQSFLAKRIGLNREYFNSGVMMFNLDLLRKDRVFDKLIEYRNNGINFFMDQDAFNYVCGERWTLLPYKYNFRTAVFDQKDIEEVNESYYKDRKYECIEDCIDDQVVLHLSDALKPWKFFLPFYTDIFLKYYSRTSYENTKLQLLSPMKYLFDEKKKEKTYLEWRFPYEKIERGKDVILYGAGDVGKSFQNQIKNTGYCNLVSWVDSGYIEDEGIIQNPKIIKGIQFDYVIVAVYNEKIKMQIYDSIADMGIDKNKIVLP